MSPLQDLVESIQPDRDRLVAHPIYQAIRSPDALRVFLEHHVFAVWDFMTLLKLLQRSLTSVDLPWMPTPDREARRLINEIVLAEESDDDGQGGHASHFEIYRDAMIQAGADTSALDRFLNALEAGSTVPRALGLAEIPDAARAFVATTWGFVESGSPSAVAAAFTLGREELIPDLFRGIIGSLDPGERDRWERFRRYLDRHVELDEGEHGPKALRMLAQVCGHEPDRWEEARSAASAALRARLGLWDGVLAEIELLAARG